MTLPDTIIPPGSTILVTGATGFIGASVSHQLCSQGYKVRATTRELAKAAPLQQALNSKYGAELFEAVLVHDFTAMDAYDEAIKGISGVIHIATDASFSTDPGAVIQIVKDCTLNILRAAQQTTSVKRFVLTGSRIAIGQPWDSTQPCEIDTKNWHLEVVERAWSASPDDPQKGFYCYGASKVEGERAAWTFVQKEKPAFGFNVVLPDVVIGPVLNPPKDGELSRPAGKLNALFHGDPNVIMPFVETMVWYVDCRDVALLHMHALLDPDVNNERILASAGPLPVNEVLQYFREEYPSRKFLPNFEGIKVADLVVNNKRGEELIRRSGQSGWIGLKESALASVFP